MVNTSPTKNLNQFKFVNVKQQNLEMVQTVLQMAHYDQYVQTETIIKSVNTLNRIMKHLNVCLTQTQVVCELIC